MRALLRFFLMFFVVMAVVCADAQTLRFNTPVAVGASASAQPVTLALKASGTIATIKVRTQGSDGFDFAATGGTCTVGMSLSAGQTCTVQVAFKPSAPGDRRGAVVLLDSQQNTLATATLGASATGPVAVFVPGTINTVAGDTYWIYAGDNVPATQANIFLPFGVAVNAAGDMIIADSSNGRIRQVAQATGMISTVAGNGVVGALGDGGAAIAASVNNPTSVALDAAGNVYFADSGNNVIRRVDAFSGIITTIAGTLGGHGFTGDGGPATAATLSTPNGICLDASGNLYFADTVNNVVRRVDAATGIITTVAGTGAAAFGGDGGQAKQASLNQPWGVAFSATGELYIADQGNFVIRKIDALGRISTVAGNGSLGFSGDGGPATQAQLTIPSGVVVDVAGNIYIADTGNNRVRKVSAATGTISTVAGSPSESITGDGLPALGAGLYGPYGLALDNQGSLYIADVFHNRIRKVSANAATILYPSIRVGRVSAAAPQVVENDGNAPLDVNTLTAVSNSQIDTKTTTCVHATPLQPLDQCVIGAEFAPTKLGSLVGGTISIDTDAANSPGALTVEGEVLDVDPAKLSLSTSLNPSFTGDTVVFTVTATSAGTAPTGTVTLLDGVAPNVTKLGTIALSGGAGSLSVSTLTGGTHTITATYAGDSSNSSATSGALSQLVKEQVADTATTLTASSTSVIAGAALKLTAGIDVTVPGTGTGAITGVATFFDGTTLVGTAGVVNGVATLSDTSLLPGQHTLTVVFGGNANYGASTSNAVSVNVSIATSRIAITSSANPGIAGGTLTISAVLTSNGGVPSGTVSFFDGKLLIGSNPIDATGLSSVTLAGSAWTVGAHALTATYAGDARNTASVSPALTETINLATTSTTLTSSLSPVGLGGSVTYTATVSGKGGSPTGTVRFAAGAVALGSAPVDARGVATLATTANTLGTLNVTATYVGDSFNAGSVSAPLLEEVQMATTTVALTTSKNPALAGDALTLSAAVSGSGAVATGTVSFLDGSVAIGSGTLNGSGIATFTTSTLALGPHTLTASYAGDSVHTATISAAVTQSILLSTTTTLNAAATTAVAGTSTSWTANVTGANGKGIQGAVALMDGKTQMAMLTTDATGTATYTSSAFAPGSHSLTANYAGDANDAASASSPVVALITIAATTTSISSSVNPAFSGTPITLSVTIAGNGGVPTGQVSFFDGTNLLGSAALQANGANSASALLTTSTLTPGVHAIQAMYSGDTNDQKSVSATISEQVVEQTTVTLASSANPSLLTDPVTLTVTVSNGTNQTPGGQVTLLDGGASVGTATLTAAGTATFTLSNPAAGMHTLQATYAGDAMNTAASSTSLIQSVVLRPTVTSFTASATSITAGQSLVLVSVVTGQGSRLPAGSVTFGSAGVVLGVAPLNAQGVATLTVSPSAGTYNVVGTYAGDALFASSASAPAAITVGPTVAFTLKATPATMTLKSGDHATLTLALTTAATFTDTLSMGCAGLPIDATCTFSENSIAVSGGVAKTLTVVVDSGHPLGAGAAARLAEPQGLAPRTGVLACMLPAGLLMLLGRRRLGPLRLTRSLGLLVALLMLTGAAATLTGCGNSLTQNATPAGSYTFQIVGTGNTTHATQSAGVQLTVTK